MRAALVYDGGIRDNGTPFYFRAAFAKLLGKELDWYTEAAPIPDGYDFYFHIDDGRDDLSRVPPKPWGYYCTDSHLGPGPRLEKARQASIVWCAQKPFADALQAEGLNAHWLPLACFPEAHLSAPEDGNPRVEKKYDVAFVGHLQSPSQSSRLAFLSDVFAAYPNFRFEYGVFHEGMARVYHQARIGVNHAVRDDLNMRFFELASIGVPQLADSRMVGLSELGFIPHHHYIPYSSTEEAIAAVRYYLRAEDEAAEIAASAKARVRNGHTYVDRVKRMLADAQALQ